MATEVDRAAKKVFFLFAFIGMDIKYKRCVIMLQLNEPLVGPHMVFFLVITL